MARSFAPLIVFLLAATSQAGAAVCETPSSISEAGKAKPQYILKGKVMRVRPPLPGSGVVPVMFSLIRAYRGNPPQIITVDFDPAGDAREFSFHAGDLFVLSTLPGTDPQGDSVGNSCTLRKLVGVSR